MTQLESIQILNGFGAMYSGQSVPLDQLLSFHPNCDNKCHGATPCGKIDLSRGQECVAASEFHDTLTNERYSFCREGSVCCNPALCQLPVYHSCAYRVENVTREIEETPLPLSALHTVDFVDPVSPEDHELLNQLMIGAQSMDEQCNSLCNVGWRNGIDSYEPFNCQHACTCVPLVAPELTLGPVTFICAAHRSLNGKRYTSYSSGDSIDSNGKAVCPLGYSCMTSGCVNHPEMVTETSSTTKPESQEQLSLVAIVLVVLAVIAACAIAGGAAYYMKRNKSRGKKMDKEAYQALNY